MKKLVSAIITTHDRQDLLARAINSVIEQTYKNLELIVVDDASEKKYEGIHVNSNIQYIYIPKEESKGGNHARNIGILAAKGEYIAFLDDDDYWLPSKIEKQVALIERMDRELVHCGRKIEYVHKDGIDYKDTLPNPNHWGDMHKKILTTICTTTTTCILAKRQALIDVGLFDEQLGFWQEYELTIRLAQRKPFYFVNEPLSVYRVDTHDNNRLTNKFFAWKKAVKYIHKKHRNLYQKLSPKDKYIVKNLVWIDAKYRCKSSGLIGRYYYYSLLGAPLKVLNIAQKIKKLMFR